MIRISTALRRLVVGALAVGAAMTVAPNAASAAYLGWGGTLQPQQEQCVAAPASYQARGEGNASTSSFRFFMKRNGVRIYGTGENPVSAFAAEFRSSWGTFPGPGTYETCAKNLSGSPRLVNFRIITDADLW